MKTFAKINPKKEEGDKKKKSLPFTNCKNCGAKLTKKDQKNGFCWTCSL
tara:strand:+ start:105 stop:251 length:147 start_codon:yes stop_codon:yes gene_type:complete